MGNVCDTVFYTGVTNDLLKRVTEHKEKRNEGFTKRFRVCKLLYYEVCENVEGAILRERQIKAGSRQKIIDLILRTNSGWNDLYEELIK
jgi:putative endonuclease